VSVPPVEYAYVVNSLAGTISEFSVGSGGALTATTFISTGNNPRAIAIDPTSRYVYVSNYGDRIVPEYTIGTGGGLSPVGNQVYGVTSVVVSYLQWCCGPGPRLDAPN
jgi:DNA-binding beta-propeller fold protein YncE